MLNRITAMHSIIPRSEMVILPIRQMISPPAARARHTQRHSSVSISFYVALIKLFERTPFAGRGSGQQFVNIHSKYFWVQYNTSSLALS